MGREGRKEREEGEGGRKGRVEAEGRILSGLYWNHLIKSSHSSDRVGAAAPQGFGGEVVGGVG